MDLLTQKDDVHVRAKPDVISQVIARIVRIIVENDVIAVPEPIIAINNVGICYFKEEAAKTKAVRIASRQAPDVASTDWSGEVPMFPRMVKMVTRIVPFMANPAIVFCVDVRRLRMAFLIAKGAMVRLALRWMRGWMRRSVRRRWAAGWNVSIANTMFAAMLWRLRVWLWSALIAMFLGQRNRAGQEKYAK